MGDGAGVLLQVPDKFLRAVVPFSLPPEGSYFMGIGFLPQDIAQAEAGRLAIEAIVEDEGLELLGWREVPVNPSVLGAAALETMPSIRQLFVGGSGATDMASHVRASPKVAFVDTTRARDPMINGVAEASHRSATQLRMTAWYMEVGAGPLGSLVLPILYRTIRDRVIWGVIRRHSDSAKTLRNNTIRYSMTRDNVAFMELITRRS